MGLTLIAMNLHCASAHHSSHGIDAGLASNAPAGTSRSMSSITNPETHLLNRLMWPLAVHRVSQEFDPDSPHDGIDIPAPRGTRIYAPADGRVVYAGHKFHGYGKMIVIEHNDRLATLFGHCSRLLVKSGEFVHRGSLIGLVGRTGHATANHLHFEVRVDKIPVNPRGFLP